MNLEWYRGLNDEQSKELKQQIKESRLVLERLAELLQNKLDDNVKAARKNVSFEKPAWSEYQAYQLGAQEQLDNIIKLIKE